MTTGSTPMRPLYLHADDGRPDDGLARMFLTPGGFFGGLVSIVLVIATPFIGYAVFFLIKVLLILLFPSLNALFNPPPPPPTPILEEQDVVEARFVVRGVDFQDELPNRVVPRLSTAPLRSQVPSELTPENLEDQPEAPPDAVIDAMTRLGDRAQAFAEIAEEREREGSEEGIEEGTEREGTEGDIYRGRLYAFFRRGWSIPTTMNRDEAQRLTATVELEIGGDLQLVRFEIRTSSGHALFDESVIQQLTRLQAADQHIPPPPEDVADQYIGRTIAVRFHGREAS